MKKKVKMTLDKNTVKKVAHLARVEVSDDHAESLALELSKILDWVEQLSEVNTEDVKPMMSPVEMPYHQRDDMVNDGNIRENLMKNAPEHQAGFFVVPKVIE